MEAEAPKAFPLFFIIAIFLPPLFPQKRDFRIIVKPVESVVNSTH